MYRGRFISARQWMEITPFSIQFNGNEFSGVGNELGRNFTM
jgi:hypothetical protein